MSNSIKIYTAFQTLSIPYVRPGRPMRPARTSGKTVFPAFPGRSCALPGEDGPLRFVCGTPPAEKFLGARSCIPSLALV